MNILDTANGTVAIGKTYKLRAAPRPEDVEQPLYDMVMRNIGLGKVVTVETIEFNEETQKVDVMFRFKDEPEHVQWSAGMVLFEPCTESICSISGGKRSKRRKKRRRTRKN